MKKVISIICVFTMLTFSLISCGKQSTDVNPSNTLDNNNVVEVTNTNENDSINYTISKEADYVALKICLKSQMLWSKEHLGRQSIHMYVITLCL